MSRHTEHGHTSVYDPHYENYEQVDKNIKDLPKKRRLRKMLENRLDRKRLQDECRDGFDELNDEFDWDNWDK